MLYIRYDVDVLLHNIVQVYNIVPATCVLNYNIVLAACVIYHNIVPATCVLRVVHATYCTCYMCI